jgi:hypothetical protein
MIDESWNGQDAEGEATVSQFDVLDRNCLESLERTMKNIEIANLRAKNTKQECGLVESNIRSLQW